MRYAILCDGLMMALLLEMTFRKRWRCWLGSNGESPKLLLLGVGDSVVLPQIATSNFDDVVARVRVLMLVMIDVVVVAFLPRFSCFFCLSLVCENSR